MKAERYKLFHLLIVQAAIALVWSIAGLALIIGKIGAAMTLKTLHLVIVCTMKIGTTSAVCMAESVM